MIVHKWSLSFVSILTAVALFAGISLSCGGGGSAVEVPPSITDKPVNLNVQGPPLGHGHSILGICSVYFDPVSGTAQVRFNRSAEVHLNLTAFLSHSNCPGGSCLVWHVTGYDPAKRIYFVDMALTNPTSYEPFDMRVIFEKLPGDKEAGTAWQVVNPDSYTNIWDPDKPFDEDKQWMNPFIAFEKEDFYRKFLKDPDGSGPKVYSDTEQLQIMVPPGSPGGEIDLILDGSWPNNCYEPYHILDMKQSAPLPPGNSSSTVYFEVIVADHQSDISGVSIYMPDIIESNDGYVELHEWPTTGPDKWPPAIDPSDGMSQEELDFFMRYAGFAHIEGTSIDFPTLRKYWCNLANEKEITAKGEYEAIIIAKSDDLAGQGFDTLYHRFWFRVGEGGSGGNPNKRLMIVFSKYETNNSDIYAYVFKTQKVVQLTNDGGLGSDELEPCVSKDASKIAFISNNNDGALDDFEVYTFNIVWDPDGNPVDFSSTPNVNLWQRHTNNKYQERYPDFSPTMSHIAYASRRNNQFDIYTMDLASHLESRVTVNFADDTAPAYDKLQGGNWLYFQSTRAGGGNTEIYGINPTTQESSFNLPTRYTFSAGFDGYPASSPAAGGYLAFVTEFWGAPDIMLYDGNKFYRLTGGGANEDPTWIDTYPSFSPNGQLITFTSNRIDHQFDIFTMTMYGESVTRITKTNKMEADPYYGGLP